MIFQDFSGSFFPSDSETRAIPPHRTADRRSISPNLIFAFPKRLYPTSVCVHGKQTMSPKTPCSPLIPPHTTAFRNDFNPSLSPPFRDIFDQWEPPCENCKVSQSTISPRFPLSDKINAFSLFRC